MANFFKKSCRNFSRYLITFRHLSTSKTFPKRFLLTNSFQNYFGCKRFFYLERKYRSFLTRGAVYGQSSVKCIHTTIARLGMEEFFPPGVLETRQPLPEEVKSGRSWRAAELRQKSNEDLHKLWYVLLKERNMLLTVQEEAKRQEVIMSSPERLQKVKKSMAMIKVVLDERKRAIEAIESNYKRDDVVELTDNNDSLNDRTSKDSKIDLHQISLTT